MKEPRNKNIHLGYVPTKSNISSLKAIMNQGRVPLSQYINQKKVKTDSSNSNLSYFDKMRAMLNKRQSKDMLEKVENEQDMPIVQTRLSLLCKDQSLKQFVDEYDVPKKINFNKEKLETYDARWKDRSNSVNVRSHPKSQLLQRLQTLTTNLTKPANTQHIIRGHLQTCTHIQSQQQQKLQILKLHRYKSVKKETINYSKFGNIYSNGQLEPGCVQLNQTIGLGANAIVRIGKHYKSQRLVAVKIYEKYRLIQPIKKRRLHQEIQILSKINHQNIIKMYSCFQDKRQFHLIFQYVPQCQTLQDYLKTHLCNISLQEKDIIATKIIQSISYLHQHGIYHRDIKPDNIMIGQNNDIKLIDFGFATTATKGETHCGTPNYMAPELFCKKSIYSPQKVDIWALGILLYHLFEGCYPFKGYDEKKLGRNVAMGVFGYNKCSKNMQFIINGALELEPGLRKSAKKMQEAMRGKQLI